MRLPSQPLRSLDDSSGTSNSHRCFSCYTSRTDADRNAKDAAGPQAKPEPEPEPDSERHCPRASPVSLHLQMRGPSVDDSASTYGCNEKPN